MAGGETTPAVGGRVLRFSDFVSSASGLDTQRWSGGGGGTGNTQTISSNRLAVTTGAASLRDSHIQPTTFPWGTNLGVLFLYEPSGTNYQTAISIRAQSTFAAGSTNLDKSYVVLLDPNNAGGDGQFALVRGDTSGSTTSIAGAGASFTFTSGNKYWVRFEAIGTKIQAKVWATTSHEPAWTLTGTDATYSTAGAIGLGVVTTNTSAATALFHNFYIYVPQTVENPVLELLPTDLLAGSSGSVAKSDSDTGTGTEAVTNIGVNGQSDTATGADTNSSLAATPTDTESGTGADAVTKIALTHGDTGTSNDNGTINASPADTDPGTGAETVGGIALNAADSGTGVDSGTVALPVSDSDTGTGVDGGESIQVVIPPPPSATAAGHGRPEIDPWLRLQIEDEELLVLV